MENGSSRLKNLICQHHYWFVLAFILLVKLLFWTWSLAVSHWFPLTPLTYFATGHHYQVDPRITEHRVDFFTLWTTPTRSGTSASPSMVTRMPLK